MQTSSKRGKDFPLVELDCMLGFTGEHLLCGAQEWEKVSDFLLAPLAAHKQTTFAAPLMIAIGLLHSTCSQAQSSMPLLLCVYPLPLLKVGI